AGHQAIFEIKAVCKIRDINRIMIHSRNAETVEHAIEELAKDGVSAEHSDAQTVCREADILITVTGARGALFETDWIKKGTHISAMGADQPGKQELPVGLLEHSNLYADYPPQSIINGEFEAIYNKNNAVLITAIGAVIMGDNPGRIDEEQITVFDSSGIALQDLSVAKSVLDQAIDQGLVNEIEF
ncbi:MAG: ornithine cyclodeaminase family protein, partial [Kordiimonadaceae bacterium]|nr:ornithine cyclodeaminase family protein [Kordiimonadaceae bacterium]